MMTYQETTTMKYERISTTVKALLFMRS